MKQTSDDKPEEFTTIRIPYDIAHWLKIEAAKADVPMYEIIRLLPGAPKKRRGAK